LRQNIVDYHSFAVFESAITPVFADPAAAPFAARSETEKSNSEYQSFTDRAS